VVFAAAAVALGHPRVPVRFLEALELPEPLHPRSGRPSAASSSSSPSAIRVRSVGVVSTDVLSAQESIRRSWLQRRQRRRRRRRQSIACYFQVRRRARHGTQGTLPRPCDGRQEAGRSSDGPSPATARPIGETASAVAQVAAVDREAACSLPERKKGKGRYWRGDHHHDDHDDSGVKRQPAAHGVREAAKREEEDPQRRRPVKQKRSPAHHHRHHDKRRSRLRSALPPGLQREPRHQRTSEPGDHELA
jgi:hypothetical protein